MLRVSRFALRLPDLLRGLFGGWFLLGRHPWTLAGADLVYSGQLSVNRMNLVRQNVGGILGLNLKNRSLMMWTNLTSNYELRSLAIHFNTTKLPLPITCRLRAPARCALPAPGGAGWTRPTPAPAAPQHPQTSNTHQPMGRLGPSPAAARRQAARQRGGAEPCAEPCAERAPHRLDGRSARCRTAATPMGNPYRSCALTRVLPAGRSVSSPRATASRCTPSCAAWQSQRALPRRRPMLPPIRRCRRRLRRRQAALSLWVLRSCPTISREFTVTRTGRRWSTRSLWSRSPAAAAVDETVILLHPPLPLVGVSTGMEREVQQNDGLADDAGSHAGSSRTLSGGSSQDVSPMSLQQRADARWA